MAKDRTITTGPETWKPPVEPEPTDSKQSFSDEQTGEEAATDEPTAVTLGKAIGMMVAGKINIAKLRELVVGLFPESKEEGQALLEDIKKFRNTAEAMFNLAQEAFWAKHR